MRRIIPAFLALIVSIFSASVRSDDPLSSAVTFNREIVRIFERKCLQCHTSEGVAMSLATYREARPWSRAIREELVEQRMPPWGAAPGYAPIADNPGLTAREMAMLLTWVDGGVPRGEDRDLPRDTRTAHAAAGEPDQALQLPAQRVPAGEDYVVRRVTLDSGAAAGRSLARVELSPGSRRAIRTAFISAVTPRGTHWIGAWTPWRASVTAPAGAAFRIPDGAKLEVELHYRGRDEPIEDRSSLAFFFAPDDAAPTEEMAVPLAKTGAGRARGIGRIKNAARVWAIVPNGPGSYSDPGGTLEVTARRPDGTVEVLLWIPQYRHDWPTPYILKEPVSLPTGTIIIVNAAGVPVSRVALSTTK